MKFNIQAQRKVNRLIEGILQLKGLYLVMVYERSL